LGVHCLTGVAASWNDYNLLQEDKTLTMNDSWDENYLKGTLASAANIEQQVGEMYSTQSSIA
jgi:hypothetical protein